MDRVRTENIRRTFNVQKQKVLDGKTEKDRGTNI